MTVRVRGRVPGVPIAPFAIGLLCGLTVVVLLVRCLRAHGAAADAARAMERSARVELCVAGVAQTVERVERGLAGIVRRPRLIGR